MPGTQVVTSSLSLARELRRYGESELADGALHLSPGQVADIGHRAGQLHISGQEDKLWPGGPGGKIVLLAAIELLEGRARPCARDRRLPEKTLPGQLQATEDERWAAAEESGPDRDQAQPRNPVSNHAFPRLTSRLAAQPRRIRTLGAAPGPRLQQSLSLRSRLSQRRCAGRLSRNRAAPVRPSQMWR